MKTTAQKRKEAREAREADPYAYQRSQEAKAREMNKKDPANVIRENTAEGAVLRLRAYVGTYPEQIDHDRDIILLDVHRMLKLLAEPAERSAKRCRYIWKPGVLNTNTGGRCTLPAGHEGEHKWPIQPGRAESEA